MHLVESCGIYLVIYPPINTPLNIIELLTGDEKRLICGLVGNCLDNDILSYLSSGSKGEHIYGSVGIIDIGMFQCLAAYSMKTLNCFSAVCMHSVQADAFCCFHIYG